MEAFLKEVTLTKTRLTIEIQSFYVYVWISLLFFTFYSLVQEITLYITVHGEAHFVIRKISSVSPLDWFLLPLIFSYFPSLVFNNLFFSVFWVCFSNISFILLTWFSVIKSNRDYIQCRFLLWQSYVASPSTPYILTQFFSLRLLASVTYNSFPLELFRGQQAATCLTKSLFFLWRLFSRIYFPMTIRHNFLFLYIAAVIHGCILFSLNGQSVCPKGRCCVS